jgi:hypothetical protein
MADGQAHPVEVKVGAGQAKYLRRPQANERKRIRSFEPVAFDGREDEAGVTRCQRLHRWRARRPQWYQGCGVPTDVAALLGLAQGTAQ